MEKQLVSKGWLALLVVVLLAGLTGCEPQLVTPQGGQAVSPLQTPPPPVTLTLPTATPTPAVTPPLPVPTLVPLRVPPEILTGEKIAFLKDKDVWLINVASRVQAQMTTSGNVAHIFGWSHDGSSLLLGIGEWPVPPETDIPRGTNLWVIQADGTKATQLADGLEVLTAAWSPVSEQIAYSTRDGDLYLIKSDGTEGRQLVAKVVNGGLAWSPIGTELAYVQLQQPGDLAVMDIAIIRIVDGSVRQLTSKAWENTDPQWSLDGQKILFQSNRTGTLDGGLWWIMNADGSSPSHLELPQPFPYRGVWVSKSPTTDQITFTDGEDIWIIDFKGKSQKVAVGSDPRWSPNGSKLAYVGKDNGIWIVNTDGTNTQKLDKVGNQPHWGK
jgi:dipeptidyl aminopeptidase/acylaminoacyl peptidase